MFKARIIFSNNEELIVKEDDLLLPINVSEGGASQGAPYKVWAHTHVGLIPSLTEFLSSCSYFSEIDNQDRIYNASSVVKIENV